MLEFMLLPVRKIFAAVLLVCLADIPWDRRDANLFRPYVPTVSMERDLRLDPETFAARAGIDLTEFRARYGASGLIRCGNATGSGQVTMASNVITTAAHVFFAEGGMPRSAGCSFESATGTSGPIPIDMGSIVTGSANPLDERATLDWAVARLTSLQEGVTPYALGTTQEMPAAVLMYGGGNGPAASMGVERCSPRRVTAVAPEGIREFSFDCSAAHGGSGAALLSDRNEVVGIFVGYRSIDANRAQPFSDVHYNFAITVEGPFRRALLQVVAAN